MFQKSLKSTLPILLTLNVIFVEVSNAQQRYSYREEQQPTRFTQRNKNIYQQPSNEEPPPDTTLQNRNFNGKMQYQQPAYGNVNNRQTAYHNAQPNNNHQNRNRIQQLDHDLNKCKIWVPADAFDKYAEATRMENDLKTDLVSIKICCDGYEPMRYRGGVICRPLCENCKNGLCIKPGECQCYEGFVKNDNDDCVFTCPLACLNGKCYLDGTCKCDPGYKLDKTRQYCQPICSNGCGENVRHNCTEPEVCACAKGYQLTDDGCQPVCEPDCGIGGTCREPNVCECERGFDLRDGVCQADCYQKCVNGICYARNRCICKPGFTYHEKSTYCIPV